jgi:hypothetical protein
MSFNNSFTAVTGATYTAAQYNTHVRDNLTAIWVYTTAGDIAYAAGATSLARLGIGANNTTVLMPASGVPSWSHEPAIKGILHTAATVYFTSGGGQTTTSTSFVDVTNGTVNIVTTQTCTIRMFSEGHISCNSAGARCTAQGVIGGTADPEADGTKPWTSNNYYVPFANVYRRAGVTAGTITCKLQFKSGGGTVYFDSGRIIVEAYVE